MVVLLELTSKSTGLLSRGWSYFFGLSSAPHLGWVDVCLPLEKVTQEDHFLQQWGVEPQWQNGEGFSLRQRYPLMLKLATVSQWKQSHQWMYVFCEETEKTGEGRASDHHLGWQGTCRTRRHRKTHGRSQRHPGTKSWEVQPTTVLLGITVGICFIYSVEKGNRTQLGLHLDTAHTRHIFKTILPTISPGARHNGACLECQYLQHWGRSTALSSRPTWAASETPDQPGLDYKTPISNRQQKIIAATPDMLKCWFLAHSRFYIEAIIIETVQPKPRGGYCSLFVNGSFGQFSNFKDFI